MLFLNSILELKNHLKYFKSIETTLAAEGKKKKKIKFNTLEKNWNVYGFLSVCSKFWKILPNFRD